MDKEALLHKKADLLLRTGQLLIQSLADSNRVDRNLRRVAAFMGFSSYDFHMHITYSTLMLNIRKGDLSVTRLKKCTHHAVNMDTITEISHLSWRAVRKNYTLKQYKDDLDAIENRKKNYHPLLTVLAAGLACGGLCRFFGGDFPATIITMIAALTAMASRQKLHKLGLNVYFNILFTAFISTFIVGLSVRTGITQTPQHALSACVLFLIPGVPMINALDDMIDLFTIVGLTRIIVASLTIAAITIGMILALQILHVQELGAISPPDVSPVSLIIAAAIAATGFAVIFNVPRHTLLTCALLGAAAILTRNLLHYHLNVELSLSTFTASALVGLVSLYVMHVVHTPIHVISVPAVIIMVPGALMYRSMMGYISISTENFTVAEKTAILVQTVDGTITSGLTLASLALGIVIASMLSRTIDARRWKRLWKEKNKSTA